MAAISEAKGGGDPAAAWDERRKAVTMKQLGKRFLEEHVPNLFTVQRYSPRKSGHERSRTARRLNTYASHGIPS